MSKLDTSAYNEYVLTTCVQLHWITSDQEQHLRTAIAHLPGTSALELLHEQQLIPNENYQALYEAILHSVQQPDPHAAASATEEKKERAVAPEVRVEAVEGFHSVNDYLNYAAKHDASDLHLSPGALPKIRVFGTMRPMIDGASVLTPMETERLAEGFLSPKQFERVETFGSVDFSYSIPALGRYRVSVARQRRGWELVFRLIQNEVPTMKALGLPEVLYTLTRYHNGLLLITGPVGCGKSTTMAAMINLVNEERHDHIITMEEPIEFVFKPANCQISQREIPTHSESFGTALRASLREDPDVIMVGEMRDLETISLAITASETGHLVMGTLHTSTAPRTLDRLLDVFPIEQQAQIRTMVSESIRGIICQQLVPRADGKGRVLALEIMTNTPAVGNLIREAKTFMLPGVMQTSKKQGMKLMDESLLDLVKEGAITPEEGYLRAENKRVFAQYLAGVGK